jgi:fibronectin type 3 domain-containing protein
MHPSRLARILAAALLAALLLPQAALAAEPSTPLPAIRLSCALVVPNPLSAIAPNRAIVCKWRAPDGVTVAKYRLWRTVDGGARQLVTVKTPDARLRHADFNIRTGHTYRYVVTAVDGTGTRVAKSAADTVYVVRPAQALRFNCVVEIDEGLTSVVCRWSDTTRASAIRYVLFRSVDGGPREAIYRVGEDGRRAFRDRDVKPGQAIRYAVVAVNASGRIVALGGPDRVVIPD